MRPGRRLRAFAFSGCDNLAMKMMWCWRCKSEVPMLDDEEFQSIMYKDEGETLRERMFSALLGGYERVTGFHETNPNAIYHHKLSLYGPACSKCGKPLRTPSAKVCGSCMQKPS